MNAIYDQHYNPLLDHGHKQGGRTITTLVLLRYSVSVDARARWSASARRTRAFTRAISYVLSSAPRARSCTHSSPLPSRVEGGFSHRGGTDAQLRFVARGVRCAPRPSIPYTELVRRLRAGARCQRTAPPKGVGRSRAYLAARDSWRVRMRMRSRAAPTRGLPQGGSRCGASGGEGGATAHGVPRTTHRLAAVTKRHGGAASLRSTRRLRAGACCQWTTPKGPPARAPYLAARDFAAFAHRRTVGRRPRRGCAEAARAVARERGRGRRTTCHARLTAWR